MGAVKDPRRMVDPLAIQEDVVLNEPITETMVEIMPVIMGATTAVTIPGWVAITVPVPVRDLIGRNATPEMVHQVIRTTVVSNVAMITEVVLTPAITITGLSNAALNQVVITDNNGWNAEMNHQHSPPKDVLKEERRMEEMEVMEVMAETEGEGFSRSQRLEARG